jgi:low affinity Fe/Cu permease
MANRSHRNSKPNAGWFSQVASASSAAVGSPWAFVLAIASVVLWAGVGPRFHWSDSWQLVMNSWTNIFTFLVVFLIQHTQVRDSKAINLKLDEVVRAVTGAKNELIDVENVSDKELEQLERRYERIRQEVRARRGGKKAA